MAKYDVAIQSFVDRKTAERLHEKAARLGMSDSAMARLILRQVLGTGDLAAEVDAEKAASDEPGGDLYDAVIRGWTGTFPKGS